MIGKTWYSTRTGLSSIIIYQSVEQKHTFSVQKRGDTFPFDSAVMYWEVYSHYSII